MKVTYEPSATITVLQRADAFDGTYVGRAKATLGGIELTAAQEGEDFNDYELTTNADGRVWLKDPTGAVVHYAVVDVLTLTALAAVLNTTPKFAEILRATVVTPGAMTSTSATLADGLNAQIEAGGSRVRLEVTGLNGGLFYFNQRDSLVITQIEGNFPSAGGANVQVELVNLDAGLTPITGESATVYSGALPSTDDFCLSDMRVALNKLRAVRITCTVAGKVWISVRQEAKPSTL